MIKQAVLLTAGVAVGWAGKTYLSKGRDAAAIKAEESLRTTFAPENIGRTIGGATATVAVESLKSFVDGVKEQAPTWRSEDKPSPKIEATIRGSVVNDNK